MIALKWTSTPSEYGDQVLLELNSRLSSCRPSKAAAMFSETHENTSNWFISFTIIPDSIASCKFQGPRLVARSL